MKIGVDARLLCKPLTGIGRYTLEMCKALSHFEEVSLHLYCPSPMSSSILKNFENSIIRSSVYNNRLFRQLWSETLLPLWAKQDNIDIFWGPAHRLPRWLPRNIARVVTIHDLVWKMAGETMRPLSRVLESYQVPAAIKTTDHIVADSQSTALSILKEFHVKENKLTVVSLGSDHLAKMGSINELEVFGINRPYFLFVGTLEPRKNLFNLLTAYSKLPKNIKNKADLVIAGADGWGKINIKNVINELKLKSHVKLLGYVDETILCTLYSNALFLAMPSLYEGFGLPLVEAMACNTPVITSNNSSMKEIIGNAGILVDPLSIDSIKSGLMQLITNHELRHKLAHNAADIAKHFQWNKSAELLINIFQKTINQRRILK